MVIADTFKTDNTGLWEIHIWDMLLVKIPYLTISLVFACVQALG